MSSHHYIIDSSCMLWELFLFISPYRFCFHIGRMIGLHDRSEESALRRPVHADFFRNFLHTLQVRAIIGMLFETAGSIMCPERGHTALLNHTGRLNQYPARSGIRRPGKEEKMREGIHPKYYQATVTCNCGNTFVTGSTSKEIHVEVCSKCHSFYTGTQKTAAAKGRIDKFNRKYGLGNN